jgi:hypothetical protein
MLRKAAEPGMVERIASFLGDNALTRSWAETVDRHVITPVEGMVLSDEDLRQQLAKVVRERTPDDGVLSEDQLRAFEALKGAPVNQGALQDAVSAAEEPSIKVGRQALATIADFNTPRSRMQDAAGLLANGRTGLTETGDYVRQFGLGSPVAAYSAVAAGGALATKAGLDAYDWWLAQQQQASKDAQLPLQGGSPQAALS